ncbi:MAG: hypothetical protein Q7R83_02720 [bacterium]|nr:hypothetical protein [bacterium]
MPKPTKNAVLICSIITIATAIFAAIAFWYHQPLWIIAGLLPAVLYEAYRTEEGASTKVSSIFLLVVLVLEIILIVFKVNFDLAAFLGKTSTYVAGYQLPLGDIKIVGPILSALLSVVLFFRTRGTYTRWLAVVICLGSLTAVYILNPSFFQTVLKLLVNGLLERL